MLLSEEYTVQKFFQLAGYPKQKYGGKICEGGCPICREGSSWKRKRRLYFVVRDNLIYCHNCGWSGDPVKFIIRVEGLTYKQVVEQSSEYDILPADISDEGPISTKKPDHSLPLDSINLFDPLQVDFYKDNKIICGVADFIKKRKLDTCINRPKSIFASLTDYIHKNRLILPFYDNNRITFYQTRTVFESTDIFLPKYLSKVGGEKGIFNIGNIKHTHEKIYIFEGPIDSCFVLNGVAVAGIQENSDVSFSNKQSNQLSAFNLYEKVWVLDSQWTDRASRKKTSRLIDQNANVFIWPQEYGKRFKDFNDMAIALNTNEIPYAFIDNNTHTGLKARLILNQI